MLTMNTLFHKLVGKSTSIKRLKLRTVTDFEVLPFPKPKVFWSNHIWHTYHISHTVGRKCDTMEKLKQTFFLFEQCKKCM